MGANTLVDIAQETIFTIMTVVAPVMISSFVVGLTMSFLQAIFQIQEYTFSFVPKIVAIFMSLLFYASWMVQKLGDFSTNFLSGHFRFIQ